MEMSVPGTDDPMITGGIRLPALAACPKDMAFGPCGGVGSGGACEIDLTARCCFVDADGAVPAHLRAWAPGAGGTPPPALPRGAGRFEAALRAGRWTVVGELNAPDSADATAFRHVGRRLAEHVDVVSVTDHSGANVHMSSLPAVAHLLAAGVEAMPTLACRDRNRIGLQGDLLGAASLGAAAALVVTGNHPAVGDSPDARPVFDLDSTQLLAVAARLRDRGELDNGRPIERRPALLLGAAVHPFAPPLDDRPAQVLRKVAAGADFVVSQHIFDVERWRSFLADVQAIRGERPFHLLGGVAIVPDEPTARRVNQGLRGFSIPEPVLRRLGQARDPQAEGIAIAAEVVAELHASPGVDGCLLAPVTVRQNLLGPADEQVDVIGAVLAQAGLAGRDQVAAEAQAARR
jgi:methylenetetrahydrofolate reductase (NADPH)